MTKKRVSEKPLVSSNASAAVPARRKSVNKRTTRGPAEVAQPVAAEVTEVQEVTASSVAEAAVPAPAETAPATRRPLRRKTAVAAVDPVVEVAVINAIVPEMPVAAPTYEEIAREAYLLWEARGYQGGSPEEDWFHAEQRLRGIK
jgi:hypothetical protein